jgi:fumarate hydratase class II
MNVNEVISTRAIELTDHRFESAPNKFAAEGGLDAMVESDLLKVEDAFIDRWHIWRLGGTGPAVQ